MRMLRLSLPALGTLLLAAPAYPAELLPADTPVARAVDHYVEVKLKETGVKPAPPADDATLLRRLTLDLVGRVPTAAEVKAYLSCPDPDKREKLVDRLMASGAYARHQADEFDVMLSAPAPGKKRAGPGPLRDYLLRAFKEDRPWDQVFRDVMLAEEKSPVQKGSSAFLRQRVRDLDRLTTDVSVLFFGVNISCAQCHDHPLVADWKQDHFYGLKSLLARTYESGGRLGERGFGVVRFKTSKGVTRQARMMFLTGQVVDDPAASLPGPAGKAGKPPRGRGKKALPPAGPPAFSARAKLVEMALAPPGREFFSKAIVNRLWHRLFGLGLVTPVDQMHSMNAPSHPELLDWLARDLAGHGYDLRRLVRGLVLSDAYSRSSRWEGESAPRANLFAVARLRALTPMQLATSLKVATTAPEQFPEGLKPEELDRKMEALENGARPFAALLDQPGDDFQVGVAEALLFSNGERVEKEFLADAPGRLVAKLKGLKDADAVVDVAVRNVLGRAPTAREKELLGAYLAGRKERHAKACKQLVWALLAGAEFRFNH